MTCVFFVSSMSILPFFSYKIIIIYMKINNIINKWGQLNFYHPTFFHTKS